MKKTHIHTTPVAVFDISSGSVAGAHTLVPRTSTVSETAVSLLASSRMFLELRDDVLVEHFVEQTIDKLGKVVATLQQMDTHRPSYIQVLLASPWFVSQTRTITYTKATPFVCTQKLIDSLVQKEIDFVVTHDMERFGAGDGVIIEKQLSLVKLNGYSLNNPFGKKAQSLELFLVVTVSPKSIIDRFKNELQKAYGAHTAIGFTTSPYATFIVSRDFLKAPSDLMVIDVGEEVTDVAFIKDTLFLYQHSFPVGIYGLYRTLVAQGIVSTLEAGAYIEALYQNKLSTAATAAGQKALDAFGSLWQQGFQQVIDNGEYSSTPPSSLYTISDHKFGEFFSTVLKKDPFLGHRIAAPAAVTTLNQELLSVHVSSLDPDQSDDSIVIGALFASRLM